jgi:hypothetical protein
MLPPSFLSPFIELHLLEIMIMIMMMRRWRRRRRNMRGNT